MSKPWPIVPLGEVLEPVSRPEPVGPQKIYRILGAHWYAKGLYTKDVKPGSEIQANKMFRVEKEDFVYNRLFAWKGSFAIATEDNHGCYVSNEFPCFVIDRNRADGYYLWRYFSRSLAWDEALGLSTGGTPTSRNRLKEEKFLDMKIPLPSLPEQQRIVAWIEGLATKISGALSLRHQASEEGEAVTRTSARSRLSSVKVGRTELGQWLDPRREGVQTGPFGAQLSSSEFTDSGIPVLTIGNVQYTGLSLRELKHVLPEKAEALSRYQVREGDILFARMGTVGRCCVVPQDANGWLINYHIIRVALDINRVDPRFIHWTIQASKEIEAYLENKVRGATREGVNSKIVAGLPCRVPSLSEQRRIVAELDALQAQVDGLKHLQAETAAELDALLPAILDRAFKG